MADLDTALENAKQWCKNNLQCILKSNNIDYSIFHYIIDNNMLGCDMRIDEKEQGLIRVSTEKLEWYRKREEYFAKEKYKPREPVEVDEESMFVHEIAEFFISFRPDLLSSLEDFFIAHIKASEIENINRKQRGLKNWPEY